MGPSIDPWPLVGRDAQLDLCRTSLQGNRGVVLSGAGGVGKTRLARELADEIETDRTVTRVAAGSLGIPAAAVGTGAGPAAPAVIVIDDAHLLDADAAQLLFSAASAGHVVPLLTVRSGEATPDGLVRLWKDDFVERVDLAPLTRAEVDRVLDVVLDGPIEAPTRVRLWELTLGSPLTLRELVRSALADGTLNDRHGVWRLEAAPTSVRLDELVRTRLDALEPEIRHVVDLVALGEPVPFAALIADVGAERLRAAEDSGLVEVVLDGRRREVRVTHPIFGDVGRRAMPESHAAGLAATLDGYLDPTPARRRDDVVRSVAWRLRAGGTVMTDEMVLAARRALYDDQDVLAIDLASRAADDDRAALILSGAYDKRGEHDRAAKVLQDLVGGSDEARALVALKRADVLFWGLGDPDEAMEQLSSIEDSLPPGEWRTSIAGMRSVLLSDLGRIDESLEIAEPIVAAEPDNRPFVTAAVAAVTGRALGGRTAAARELAERAFAARTALGDQLALVEAGLFVVFGAMAAHEAGDLDESEAAATLAYDVCVAQGIPMGQAWCATVRGRTALTRGRLSDADRWFVEAAGLFAATHQHGPLRWSIAGSIFCAAWTGDADRCAELLSSMGAVPDHPAALMGPEVERALAWADVAAGRRDAAIARLRATAADALDAGSVSLASGALHDLVRLDHPVALDDWARVEACDGRLAAGRSRLAGGVASGDPTEIEGASHDLAAIGADLYAAEAAIRAAELFERHGAMRDATRCRHAAAAAQQRTGEDWFATLDRPVGLVPMTARELEIAERAAAGSTSKQIAVELSISTRTVDNHLQRVYDKLGVRSRGDLGPALAAR